MLCYLPPPSRVPAITLPEPLPASVSGRHRTADARVVFTLRLAESLHRSGLAVHQLEDVLTQVSGRMGLEGQFSLTPTSILAAFGALAHQQTYMLRVDPGSTDLGRLTRLDRVIIRVLDGSLDTAGALTELDRIESETVPYRALVRTIAYALASAASARFLGGGTREVLAASLLGAGTGLLALVAARLPPLERVFVPAAALLSGFLASALAHAIGGLAVSIVTLAALIVLLPGMALTTAMAELTTRHLSAGTSRMSLAIVTFVGLAIGVHLGLVAAERLLGPSPHLAPVPLPLSGPGLSLILLCLSLTVLLKAEPRDLPWLILAGAIALLGTRIGQAVLGSDAGVFVGALLVGVGSSAFSTLLRRPEAIMEVPGILVLVPGSAGFQSITSMVAEGALSGVEAAFRVMTVAATLVAGLLVAKLVAPRRSLV